MSQAPFIHTTVLLEELINGLSLSEGYTAVDCTAGGGGHTARMLDQTGPSGTVWAIDRDPVAISNLQKKFADEAKRGQLILKHGACSEMLASITGPVDAIAADLGVSSPQLDEADRGFSFMKDGPLDMRMNQKAGPDASEIVATYSQQELTDIFRKWGEEPKAKFIAQAIVAYREHTPITRTLQLAEIVRGAVHYKTKSKKHPATKVFQALRICVNDELGEVEEILEKAMGLLKPGGRLGIITFHSLEDRIVKQFFKKASRTAGSRPELRGLPLTESQLEEIHKPDAKIIKPFPVNPTDEEIAANPRARSAKLRVMEKAVN